MNDKQINSGQFIDTSLLANDFLARRLGLIILLVIKLDSFDIRHRAERDASIINRLTNTSELSSTIIDSLTKGIYREIYPEWIYRETSLDDLLSLALNSNDDDFMLQVLKLFSDSTLDRITLNNNNAKNLIAFMEAKHPCGPRSADYLMKTLNILKAAIIAGVLSAGKKKIDSIIDKDSVFIHTTKILNAAIDSDLVRKIINDKKYTNGVGVAVRQSVKAVMTPVFKNYVKNRLLPLPTALECCMVTFLALWSKDSLWTGKVTSAGIPILGTVYQKTFTVPKEEDIM